MDTEIGAIEELKRFATQTVQLAGKEALSFYGRGKADVKFDEELVTEAEIDLGNFFEKRLRTHYPEHQIFRGPPEDMAYTHEGKRYMWIFDPIDGVANFLAGIPVWGASLALLENFWPIFGVFFMPATGDCFYAQAGQKAFRGEREISISPQDEINNESVLLTYSRFHQHYHSDFPGKMGNLGCTAAHICYVASGRAEAAFIANESYQDLAAACVIVEAAGGMIYNLNGERFMVNEYLDGERRGDHFLVAAPEIYSQARSTLRALR